MADVLSGAWRHCVGTGRFNLALRRDYQESLALVQREIGFRHIRGHGLLSDDAGIHRPYTHEGRRQVRHAFTYVDQVIDAYLELGVRPFVELGFMPSGLASGEQTVFWWKGNVTPPKDHGEWAELVRATLIHLIGRYGLEEVRTWPIEVWNEPNLELFWKDADEAAYHRLYEVTAHTIKEIDPGLQVGGPAVSPGADEWMKRFADFVVERDVPVDFVSRHAYSSAPPRHVPFGSIQALAPASALLEQFATPRRQLAGGPLADLPVHITEFNSSYCPDNALHDTAFHAAYLAPVLAGGGEVCDSFSYWTFCDVFEEAGIPTSILHGGFGLLAHRQLKKPTYHLYAFMARMGSEILSRGEDHLVTRHADGRVTALAWAVEPRRTKLAVPFGSPEAFVVRSTVSEEHGNLRRAWLELGSPHSPTERQLGALRTLAEPYRTHRRAGAANGLLELDLSLGLHEVTLVEAAPVTEEAPPWPLL